MSIKIKHKILLWNFFKICVLAWPEHGLVWSMLFVLLLLHYNSDLIKTQGGSYNWKMSFSPEPRKQEQLIKPSTWFVNKAVKSTEFFQLFNHTCQIRSNLIYIYGLISWVSAENVRVQLQAVVELSKIL